jgi:AMP-binding enzyme C-terminal domain
MPEAPLITRDGHAVPPQEVEQVLLGHPAVAEVAVVGVPDRFPVFDRFPGEIVAAAVRLSAPLPSAAADLTRYCEIRLAPYKVPVHWLFVPALPRTTTGEPCRATLAARLVVASGFFGPGWAATARANLRGTATARLTGVDPRDLFLPRPATEDLRIPRQLRRSWAPDDLDEF